MSDQTERERLLKLASDIDCDSTKLVSLDVAEMNAVVAALRFQAAALDGGAVSQDVELATLRRQLAEREAEVELLKARISAGIETFNEIARG